MYVYILTYEYHCSMTASFEISQCWKLGGPGIYWYYRARAWEAIIKQWTLGHMVELPTSPWISELEVFTSNGSCLVCFHGWPGEVCDWIRVITFILRYWYSRPRYQMHMTQLHQLLHPATEHCTLLSPFPPLSFWLQSVTVDGVN